MIEEFSLGHILRPKCAESLGLAIGRVPEALGCRASGAVCTYEDVATMFIAIVNHIWSRSQKEQDN